MKRLTVLLAWLMLSGTFSILYGQQKLFCDKVRTSASKPMNKIMDFLETYFVELKNVKGTTITDKMADDKVHFRKGRLSDYYSLCDSVPFTISLVDKHYEVSWLKDGNAFITVVFPAQYNLIMGKSQKEIQQGFRSAIISAKHKEEKWLINTEQLEPYNDSIWFAKHENYELESLNDATYYIKCGEDKAYCPLFDSKQKEFSAANLFQGIADGVDRKIYVEQSVYGMTIVNYTIMLSQWLDYCKEQNLKVYFAVEEEREDGIKVMVIAQSNELCYNHLLSVILRNDFVQNPKSMLKAKITPFIPTHNIKDLYQKEIHKRNKKRWN